MATNVTNRLWFNRSFTLNSSSIVFIYLSSRDSINSYSFSLHSIFNFWNGKVSYWSIFSSITKKNTLYKYSNGNSGYRALNLSYGISNIYSYIFNNSSGCGTISKWYCQSCTRYIKRYTQTF